MARSYGLLKPGRGKIHLCLRNHSAKQIILSKQTAVGETAAANIILALLAPKTTGQQAGKSDTTAEKRKHKRKNY